MKSILNKTTVDHVGALNYAVTVSDGRRTSESIVFLPEIPRGADISSANKQHAFSVFVNCKSAEFAMSVLYEFLGSLPAFYEKRFRSYDFNDAEFGERFRNDFDDLKFEVDTDITRMIRILHSYLDLRPNHAHHDHAVVLKALLSLKLIVNYVGDPPKSDGKPADSGATDFRTFQLLLVDMTRLQEYLTMHCLNNRAGEINSQFYGFWVQNYHGVAHGDVEPLIEILQNAIGLKPTQSADNGNDTCSFSQNTLENLTTYFNSKIVSSVIQKAEIEMPAYGNRSLDAIAKRVSMFYDIDDVFDYVDGTLMAMFNLLFYQIEYLKKSGLLNKDNGTKLTERLKAIGRTVSKNKMNLPVYVGDFFSILSKVEKLKEIDENAKTFELKNVLSRITLTPVDRHTTTVHASFFQNDILGALDVIENGLRDLECFDDFFSSIRQDHVKQFRPLLVSEYDLVFNSGNDEQANECGFVKNTYALALQARMLFNGYVDIAEEPLKSQHYSGALNAIVQIQYYCAGLIERRTENQYIRKIAYSALVFLMNLPVGAEGKTFDYHVQRVLHAIMNAMSDYDVRYCIETDAPVMASRSNILLFNKIDFNDFGNKHSIEESMKRYLKRDFDDVGFERFGRFELTRYEFLVANKLYVVHNHQLVDYFISYSLDDVRIYWKGSVQNIETIFNNETEVIQSPFNLYTLYDVFFKFSTAVVFVQTRRYLLEKNTIHDTADSLYSLKRDLDRIAWNTLFPRRMETLLKDIVLLLETPRELIEKKWQENKIKQRIEELNDRIEKQFDESSVTFSSRPNDLKKDGSRIDVFIWNYAEHLNKVMFNFTKFCNEIFNVPK